MVDPDVNALLDIIFTFEEQNDSSAETSSIEDLSKDNKDGTDFFFVLFFIIHFYIFSESEMAEIRRENEELKTSRTCKVCLDADVQIVFLPCGHFVCCQNCAREVSQCPMCRIDIMGSVRT